MHYSHLSLLGLFVGTVGTLIGVGARFLLMPILLLLHPKEPAELIASISLAVVALNAFSGSIAYAKLKRIDYKSGLIFSLTGLPGSILDAYTTSYLSRGIFDLIMGVVMILIAIFLFFRSPTKLLATSLPLEISEPIVYDLKTGIMISAAVGFFSSLLGIGGGIVHEPAMVVILNFPVPIATATSHFILCIIAFAGTLIHIFSEVFVHGQNRTLAISIGVIIGAQIGAKLSHRVSAKNIINSIALALFLVGIRILIKAFFFEQRR